MSRKLNNASGIGANLYYCSNNLESTLDKLTASLHFPPNHRINFMPRGHFHYSPVIVGSIIARGMHFLCHITTDVSAAIIDTYGVNLGQNEYLSQMIHKHFQPVTILEIPEAEIYNFDEGNYASFTIPKRDFSQMADVAVIWQNQLKLNVMSMLYIPPDEDEYEYDILRMFAEGYFAVHATADSVSIDLLVNREITKDIVLTWFPAAQQIRLLTRPIYGYDGYTQGP